MKSKISQGDEIKIAVAEVLHKSGRFSNTVYIKDKCIFIYNTDHTVLLRFEAEKKYEEEIRFFAGDYSSPSIEMVEKGIVFHIKGKDAYSEELCRIPDITFEDIEKLYDKYKIDFLFNKVTLAKGSVFEYLREDLSHVEFGLKEGNLYMVQRDLYSGKIIKSQPNKGKYGLEIIKGDWEFRGFRTSDILAILDFVSLKGREHQSIDFYFIDPFYTWVECDRWRLKGLLTTCIYDELGVLESLEEIDNGREKQKIGRGIQKVDREIEEGASSENRRKSLW